MSTLDVICVGAATLDTIAAVATIPADDERVVADAFVTAGGGPAATAAVALARLGARVGFCGVVGNDQAGRAIRDGLADEGVNVDWLDVDDTVQTARSVVLASASSGGRTIVTTRAPEPHPRAVPLEAARWVHVDQSGLDPVRSALAATPDRPRLSIDAGNPMTARDWTGVDLYVPSVPSLRHRYPAAPTIEAALAAATDEGAAQVVATDGARGSWVRADGVNHHVASFTVEVVSTLGAGDVFHGALLAGLVTGRSLLDAVRDANAAAAMSCRALDGRSAIPRRDALDAFVAKRAESVTMSGSAQ
ncbi:PfkB family carbohydrate kinase [Actinopolymorpha pittospori]|uniref:Sugar/nucleoside kinase (Ribokinase family) n=1 Tax=Actinopolymorpha pittospori TaxID=648752 RepID=A0A927R8P8_9ACTN|nr:PfkB family carbohydrate kinase [Actinopolymorpha pittospori]MBE1603165.1 sugar/nucleoside kinase (ribokinase family) [Actinopolymorpha pittospori]